ncbi:ERV1 (YGR029W) [Zygosaccharomyces parabailii]|uniref:Sulfhydryl oxidase n=1 Tax=Zygosaccharomyces bailii (strain CLIB 213 / ATCC 58445 / CBS 680 / BCRC 21525 / NBRC 1098 / NCYC 1416 / NRRL Y-2227) TaxID=1333698 RepID=A0A8J2T700_ZYGB2|nr:ERV1 (YGR029W) [Zygosaccharomyces parabailii]CDF88324.1 BN860_07426g1_1 [Zygosaccharomyces bailii CLIB 213]
MTNSQPQEGLSGRKIVYDENGKPCRSCNTLLDFKFATGKISTKQASVKGTNATTLNSGSDEKIPHSKAYVKADPADVERLGNSSWTLLHTISANYPSNPREHQKSEMKQFLQIFSHIYPCSWCASDFEQYIRNHAPKLDSRDDFGRWMCEAHNEVNAKLNKELFDCNFWKNRWKDGWDE